MGSGLKKAALVEQTFNLSATGPAAREKQPRLTAGLVVESALAKLGDDMLPTIPRVAPIRTGAQPFLDCLVTHRINLNVPIPTPPPNVEDYWIGDSVLFSQQPTSNSFPELLANRYYLFGT